MKEYNYDIKDINNDIINNKNLSCIPLNKINMDTSLLCDSAILDLTSFIKDIIKKSKQERNSSKPDPIAALFQNIDHDLSEGNEPVSYDDYYLFEKIRINDKWRSNHIGKVFEKILSLSKNVSPSESLDLKLKKNGEIFALIEAKNRFNTMNSSSAIRLRKEMEELVTHTHTQYTQNKVKAFLVERIPKGKGDEVYFSPSDSFRTTSTANREEIKKIGVQCFFEKYTDDKLTYLKSIVLIAKTMAEEGVLPKDYDMSFIFKLFKESLS